MTLPLRTNSVNNTWASSQRPSMGWTKPPAARNSATLPASSVPRRIDARVEASHLPSGWSRHVGVAPLSHEDRELLEVLQPLRAVVLRVDERQQQEAEAGACRCSCGATDQRNAPARRWRRAAVCRCRAGLAAPQAKAIMPLSLAQNLCGLPEPGSRRACAGAPGDPLWGGGARSCIVIEKRIVRVCIFRAAESH